MLWWVVFFGWSLVLIGADHLTGPLSVKDVDDQLREWQIRTLFEGRVGWFDPVLPQIALPGPYTSPWSRLVDLPYVTLATLFSTILPAERALALAFVLWPLIMLAIFTTLVIAIVARDLHAVPGSNLLTVAIVLFLPSLMVPAVFEFSPTRIDHHNLQILALLTMLYGLQCLRRPSDGGPASMQPDRFWSPLRRRWPAWSPAFWIGFGAAISLIIGLEGLPFVVVIVAGLVAMDVLRAGVEPDGAWDGAEEPNRSDGPGGLVIRTSMVLGVCLAAGALVFVGPATLGAGACDALSGPVLLLGSGGCIALCLGAALSRRCGSVFGRFAAYGLPAILAIALAAWLYPICLSGPYDMIDPLTQALWLDRIIQENSFLVTLAFGQYALGALFAVWTVIVVTAAVPVFFRLHRRPDRDAAALALVWLAAFLSVALTLVLTRYLRFGAAMAPLMLPLVLSALVDGERQKSGSMTRGLMAVATGLSLSLYLGAAVAWVRPPPPSDQADGMAAGDCRDADFSSPALLPPGKLLLPEGAALNALLHAPRGIEVGPIPYHRAAPGLKRGFEAFLTLDAGTRRAAMKGFDYLGFCQPLDGLAGSPQTLYATLAAGHRWPGLEPIGNRESRFRLWRIDHDRLQ